MAATLPDELANLPPPQIVEEIDYEARLALFVTKLVADMNAVGIAYDVNELEYDPAKILLQVVAYFDVNLRQRINAAVQSNLLAYAYGGDLDILGQFYDTPRLFGETDDFYRLRIIRSIRGRSPGGTAPRYESVAMAADPRVANAVVYTIGKSPVIYIAVFSKEAGGVADSAMLAAVTAAVNDPAVRLVNDTIVVLPAVRRVVNVVADVWLLPQSSDTLIVPMEAALRAAWDRDDGLGRDLTRSYIGARMMLDGVQEIDVTSPAISALADFNEALAIGTVTLNIKGRKF